MANERLQDLTPDEIVARYAQLEAQAGPIVKLHNTIYGDKAARKEFEALTRRHADRLFPNHTLPEDPDAVADAKVKPLTDALEQLRGELEGDRKAQRHAKFQQSMIDAGAEPGDLQKIEEFMLENQFGPTPAAVRKAVEAYYEATNPAVPNSTDPFTGVFEPPGSREDDEEVKKILALGPDEDGTDLTMKRAYRILGEYGLPAGGAGRRR